MVDLSPLITKTIRFDEINDVMPLSAEGKACKLVAISDPKDGSKVAESASTKASDPNIKGTVGHH